MADTYGDGGTGERNDCTVRALAVAACVPYEAAHAIYKRLGRQDRRRLRHSAIKTPQAIRMATGNHDPVRLIERPGTIGRFIKENGRKGHWILAVAGHHLAVVDGQVYDWANFVNKTRRIIKRAYRVA
jgi:hypothetical protein